MANKNKISKASTSYRKWTNFDADDQFIERSFDYNEFHKIVKKYPINNKEKKELWKSMGYFFMEELFQQKKLSLAGFGILRLCFTFKPMKEPGVKKMKCSAMITAPWCSYRRLNKRRLKGMFRCNNKKNIAKLLQS